MIANEWIRTKGKRSGEKWKSCTGRRTTQRIGIEYRWVRVGTEVVCVRWDIEWGVRYILVGECCLYYSLSSG